MTELDYSLAAVRKELSDLEQRREQLLALRSRLAHKAHESGTPVSRIGELLGVTRAMAHRIVRRGR